MTATQAARVEVLTAEVRVLMVGSRQVTLSVYRQLDFVESWEIAPFGRVRDRADADDERRFAQAAGAANRSLVYVVGASLRDGDEGSLVRSAFDPGEAGHAEWAGVQLARLRAYDGNHAKILRACGRCVRDADEKCIDAGWSVAGADPVRCGCGCWTRSQCEDAIRAAEWGALPLIVLAGLR